MVDWSAAFTSTSNRTAMRHAERQAKEARLRLWRSWEPPRIQGLREFSGEVVEVQSGDTLIVRTSESPRHEIKLSLSSVKAPRLGNPRRPES